jgi:hypothetical protein
MVFFIGSFILLSCTKKQETEIAIGTIKIDLKYDNLIFDIAKIGSYTDSLNLTFSSKTLYNCNLYKINYALQQNGNNYTFVMGNTFYDPGFCQFGNFPAMAKIKLSDFKIGIYNLQVIDDSKTYKGTFKVTATQYIFDWGFDDVLHIANKVVNK